MRIRPVDWYVSAVCTVSVAGLFLVDWTSLPLSSSTFTGLSALIVLAIVSESLALTVTIARSAGNASITFLLVLACQLLFGSPASVILVLAFGTTVELFIRRKPPKRVVFNLAQWTLAAVLAGMTFDALGGVPLPSLDGSTVSTVQRQLLPFAGFSIVFLGSNHLAVSLAISLDQGLPFSRVWKNRAGKSGANIFYDLIISPIALAVAFLFIELGLIGILISLLPLLFIRHAYLTNYKLQESNRDLLTALVKAIETRDPYTSGHSLRVSRLAGRIGEGLGLNRRRLDAIETAALLHDIGKIEAVYSEILNKPGDLTKQEREIIESHVHKGAELLESLSSFGKSVIGSVRHHHERVDGKGYPDGLVGDEIPLGARIIKVCDAIDAMLSDRPYRKALPLDAVRVQLDTYRGTQFDAQVVDLVTGSSILEEHQSAVEVQRKGRQSQEVEPESGSWTRTRIPAS